MFNDNLSGGGILYSTNATTQIWSIWNQMQYSLQPTAATNQYVWTQWISNQAQGTGGITTALTNQQIWTTWVNAQGSGTLSQSVNYRPPTEEELTRQREQVARAQQEEKEANERAAELLLAYLTDDQKRTWRENNVIDLVSQRKKRYRVKRGVSHNVIELNDKGKEVATYCAHPDGVPVDDVVLTQVLALKYAEDHFLKVANKRQLAA
jgi:hypothetical protein